MAAPHDIEKISVTVARSRLRRIKHQRENVRWKIRIQGRRLGGLKPGSNPQDWRNWRTFMAIPILFHSEEEAWLYMRAVDIFKNLPHRKLSASVERVVIKTKAS